MQPEIGKSGNLLFCNALCCTLCYNKCTAGGKAEKAIAFCESGIAVLLQQKGENAGRVLRFCGLYFLQGIKTAGVKAKTPAVFCIFHKTFHKEEAVVPPVGALCSYDTRGVLPFGM